MIANSLNPDKDPIDFLHENIVELEEHRLEVKEENKLRMQELKRERSVAAKQKRGDLLEERTKHSILQLHRWELLKEKKAEAIEMTLEELRHSQNMQRMVKLMHTYAII